MHHTKESAKQTRSLVSSLAFYNRVYPVKLTINFTVEYKIVKGCLEFSIASHTIIVWVSLAPYKEVHNRIGVWHSLPHFTMEYKQSLCDAL